MTPRHPDAPPEPSVTVPDDVAERARHIVSAVMAQWVSARETAHDILSLLDGGEGK